MFSTVQKKGSFYWNVWGWLLRLLIVGWLVSQVIEGLRAGVRESWVFFLPVVVGLGLGIFGRGILFRFFDRLVHSKSNRYVFASILGLPFLFQLLLIVFLQTTPTSDYADYWNNGRRLWEQGEYIEPRSDGLIFRAHKLPGMAIYLAGCHGLFGSQVMAAQIINALFILLGNLLFFDIVRRDADRKAAIIALAVFSWWPSRSFSAALLSYDAPGSFCLLLFWWLAGGHEFSRPMSSRRWAEQNIRMFLAGLVGGMAAMLRQPNLLLVLVFPFCRLASDVFRYNRTTVVNRGWLEAGCLLAGLGVVLGAWGYRNHAVLGKVILASTQGGPSFYRGFHPQAGRHYTNVGWEDLIQEAGRDELRINEVGYQRGWEFIRRDPAGALVRVVRKWYTLLESDHSLATQVFDDSSRWPSSSVLPWIKKVFCGLCDVWYLWMAMIGLSFWKRIPLFIHYYPLFFWPVVGLLLAVGIFSLFESQPRYMVMYHCFWAAIMGEAIRIYSGQSARYTGSMV